MTQMTTKQKLLIKAGGLLTMGFFTVATVPLALMKPRENNDDDEITHQFDIMFMVGMVGIVGFIATPFITFSTLSYLRTKQADEEKQNLIIQTICQI